MEDNDRCKQLAHSFAHSAAELFEKDGYLVPVLILMDEDGDGLILSPHPQLSEHPGEGCAMLLMMLGHSVGTRHFAFICESWVKAMEHKKEDPLPEHKRGQFAAEADTNPEVKTSLVVQVYSVKDWDASHTVMYTLNAFEAGGMMGLGLEPEEWSGFPEGYVPDILKKAYISSPPVPIPSLAEVCQALLNKQVCMTASVLLG